MTPNKETVRIKMTLITIEIHLPFPVFLMPNTRAIIGHITIAITTIGPKVPKEIFTLIRPNRIRDIARKIYGDILAAINYTTF
jgi:hypothetical protein